MGMFNFFGESEHKVFDYKPVYYDKAEEERKKKFGAVDGTYAPGCYVKGAFRDGAYQKTRSHLSRTQTVIGIVTLLLIAVVLYFIAKFYQLL